MYDFLEMELSESISKFLEKSTKNQDKEANHSPGFEFMQVYSTSRNAQQSMNAWRGKIDVKLLNSVQDSGSFLSTSQFIKYVRFWPKQQSDCKEMMEAFGYTPFSDIDHARNLTVPYFVDFYQ